MLERGKRNLEIGEGRTFSCTLHANLYLYRGIHELLHAAEPPSARNQDVEIQSASR
jgi:hypothetical protein